MTTTGITLLEKHRARVGTGQRDLGCVNLVTHSVRQKMNRVHHN